MIPADTLEKSWFFDTETDHDVILSSRVRLGRNFSNYNFLSKLSSEKIQEIDDRILGIFQGNDKFTGCIAKSNADLNTLEKRLLTDLSLFPEGYGMFPHRPVIFAEDMGLSGYTEDVDHFRIASTKNGLNIQGCYDKVLAVDKELEILFPYAASMEWGYLSPDPLNSGSGMKISAVAHLPALQRSGMLDSILKAILEHGFQVKGTLITEDTPFFQISNGHALHHSENAMIRRMDNLLVQLKGYEQKAVNEILEKERIQIEDMVKRSLGIMLFCKKISYQETMTHISNIRFGAIHGLCKVSKECLGSLIFTTKKSYIQTVSGKLDISGEEEEVLRAEHIHQMLKKAQEGFNV